jgi:hypothetical protein
MQGDSKDDPHAIVPNLVGLTWKIACFRVVLRGRELATQKESGKPFLSPLVHGLLDQTFVDAVLMGLRRIVGSFSNPEPLDHPKRGTYSVNALMTDIAKHRQYVTRENLLRLEELPLDADAVRRAEMDFLRMNSSDNEDKELADIPPHVNSRLVECRHQEIDWLCRVRRENRQPSDCLDETQLASMCQKIRHATEGIRVWADKYVAHIASAESRASALADQVTLHLTDLWQAHEVLCRVVACVDSYLVSRTHHEFLPIPLPSHFAYLDRPLLGTVDVSELRNFWRQMVDQFRGFNQVDPAEFVVGTGTDET